VRRRLIALTIAVLAFALIAASAASLGGINSTDLGADTTVVTSCDTDGVDVQYRWRWHHERYELRRVIVTGIADACLGQQISMTISDGTNQVSRGPSPINDRPGVDNNRRGWGVGGAHFDAESDFSIGIVISG
jgi:hypothetical protein